jgi:hypothetical protein
VEQIRQGLEPGEALERTLDRIRHDKHRKENMQCGLMVIRADGAWAGRSLRAGFQLAAASSELSDRNVLYDVTESHLTEASNG